MTAAFGFCILLLCGYLIGNGCVVCVGSLELGCACPS